MNSCAPAIAFPVRGFANVAADNDTSTRTIRYSIRHPYLYLAWLSSSGIDGIDHARARCKLACVAGIEDRSAVGRPPRHTAGSGLESEPPGYPAIGRHDIDFTRPFLAARKCQPFAIW